MMLFAMIEPKLCLEMATLVHITGSPTRSKKLAQKSRNLGMIGEMKDHVVVKKCLCSGILSSPFAPRVHVLPKEAFPYMKIWVAPTNIPGPMMSNSFERNTRIFGNLHYYDAKPWLLCPVLLW